MMDTKNQIVIVLCSIIVLILLAIVQFVMRKVKTVKMEFIRISISFVLISFLFILLSLFIMNKGCLIVSCVFLFFSLICLLASAFGNESYNKVYGKIIGYVPVEDTTDSEHYYAVIEWENNKIKSQKKFLLEEIKELYGKSFPIKIKNDRFYIIQINTNIVSDVYKQKNEKNNTIEEGNLEVKLSKIYQGLRFLIIKIFFIRRVLFITVVCSIFAFRTIYNIVQEDSLNALECITQLLDNIFASVSFNVLAYMIKIIYTAIRDRNEEI